MEIARPPVGEKVAQRGELLPLASMTTQHSKRAHACAALSFTYSSMKMMEQDSSFSYFVFLWLHPPQRRRHQNRRGAAAPNLMKGKGAASWAPATAGPASWAGQLVSRHTTPATLPLYCFCNFMKKEGRSKTAGARIAGGFALPIRGGGQAGQRRMLAGGAGGGREDGMMWWRERQSGGNG